MVRLVFALSKQAQQVKEEIDDIEIEVDGRVNVLLRRDLVHNHVSVKDDEQREENCSSSSQSTVHCLALEKHLTNTNGQKS